MELTFAQAYITAAEMTSVDLFTAALFLVSIMLQLVHLLFQILRCATVILLQKM